MEAEEPLLLLLGGSTWTLGSVTLERVTDAEGTTVEAPVLAPPQDPLAHWATAKAMGPEIEGSLEICGGAGERRAEECYVGGKCREK